MCCEAEQSAELCECRLSEVKSEHETKLKQLQQTHASKLKEQEDNIKQVEEAHEVKMSALKKQQDAQVSVASIQEQKVRRNRDSNPNSKAAVAW